MDQAAHEELPNDRAHRARRPVARVPRVGRPRLALTFVLALVFIYLVLAAQFESFVAPFVIMLTVPLAMTGALAGAQARPAARSTSTARSGW